MIISFRDKRTRAFFDGERVQAFQRFERQAVMRLDRLHAADCLMALNTPGNRLEALKGDRKGQYSIRINDQWEWPDGSPGPTNVEIVDYHQEVNMGRLLIHPGEHLADELEALGMSANQLAKELGVPANRITQTIRGKPGITGDTALRLGRWFGTGPEIWINLQKNYELRLAAEEIGEALNKIPRHGGKSKAQRELRA